jgi:hypothetical protein
LLSVGGTNVPIYFFTKSGYFLTAVSVSQNITPSSSNSLRLLWYTTSDSNWVDVPAKKLLSASGIPSLLKVSLIASGTLSQEDSVLSADLI